MSIVSSRPFALSSPTGVSKGLRTQAILRYAPFDTLPSIRFATQGERTYSGRTDLLRTNGLLCIIHSTLHHGLNSYLQRLYMPGERPGDVFAHQLRRMRRARLQRGHDLRLRHTGSRRIAQPDRQIAQPTLVTDASDRAAFQLAIEFFLAPAEQLDHRRTVESVAHVKIVQRGALRELVPRAHQLAIVAAVHAVADQRPQFQWDAALQLDRQIGNAAPRIEPVGAEDGLRRAD